MAPLYGRLQGNHWHKEVTRTGVYEVESTLETWDGKITTYLNRDGEFVVTVSSKYGGVFDELVVATGNVDTESGRREAARYAESMDVVKRGA
jgi:peptidyl-tRNA hydrolase